MEARLTTANLSPLISYGFSLWVFLEFCFPFLPPTLLYILVLDVFLWYTRYGLYFPMVFALLETLRDKKAEILTIANFFHYQNFNFSSTFASLLYFFSLSN